MSAPRRPSAQETDLAQAKKAMFVAALSRKRLLGLVGFLMLFACAIVVAVYGPELVAFSIAGISVIVLLQGLSAHSHLQVVRERKAAALVPDFSVLRQPQSDRSSQSPSAS